MKLHEYQAKELLRGKGLPLMPGQVASTVDEAVSAATEIGYPVVLKSQVHVGGRGKAGGIRVVKNEADLKKNAAEIFALLIKDLPVKKILVEKKVDIKTEYYFGIIMDREKRAYTMLLSGEGGVDIEETAREKPDAIKKITSDEYGMIQDFQVRAALPSMGVPKELHNPFIKLALKLMDAFRQLDCSLLEINPLGVNDAGELILVDSKIITDDNALFRQKQLQEFEKTDPEHPEEVEAKDHGLSYVKLDGNVGCIVNGAGLAMATMDVIKHFGGDPANFLDIGGSSSVEKMSRAVELILSDGNVKVILVNIFGGITRCDDVARGLIEVLKTRKIEQPVFIRLSGTNEEIARELLNAENIPSTTRMEEAVKNAVGALNK